MRPSPALLPAFLFLAILSGCNSQDMQPGQGPAGGGLETASGASAEPGTATDAVMQVGASRGLKRSLGVPDGVTNTAGITIPRGFAVQELAANLTGPRRLEIAPGGSAAGYDLFVTESSANRVTALRVRGNRVQRRVTFTRNTSQPYGLAFAKNWLYVANTDKVVRFPYKNGDLTTSAQPEFITELTEGGYNQHWTRNLLFSRDGKQLFVTVGSACNTCEEKDPQRAAISVMDPDGKNKRLYATGLRNPVGLAWYPGTNELWTAVNERDNLGDDVPPDYITSVKDGGFYGWPYAYTDINGRILPDPTFGTGNADKVSKTIAPTVPVQAHSANLGVAFHPLQGGKFPREYQGDAFLTFHGSWNRSAKTGYKVVRVDFVNGRPAAVSDFLTGFLKKDEAWGRPVDILFAPDGSLLFSDDGSGKIWRISYKN